MLHRSLERVRVVLRHILASAKMSTEAGSASEEVIFQTVGNKGVITLNRPSALNALNLPMIRKMYPQMLTWEDSPEVSLVIIKGTGKKAFCAGGDVRALYDAGQVGDRLTQDFFREEYMLNYKIGTYKKPYVAIIDGVTMGGGVGLSVHGKYRVATERSLFAMPETAIGLFTDVGGGYFLPRLEGKLGVYLALTGFRLKGRDVYHAGVATHFVDADKLEALEDSLLSLKSTTDNDISKVLGTYHEQSTTGKGSEFVLEHHIDRINTLFAGESLEEIFDRLNKDGSEWAMRQLETLRKMSPTSMKVCLRQVLEGAKLSLEECLKMDYRLAQRFMEDKDFFEGVRAVLVDKDNSPKWDPPSIEGVTKEKIDWYFSHLPPEQELKL
ncbi:3-hydroxyisobutyryl-CoA hydrolase, mitochondrial-like [Liolophura sinensis]|uniref:3-hydroxyisobutyryl-CoA hydrolase, mitochondrial-like n=1 Tax=Liolophura sinensis TaxID=3198878 RepID=UPI0031582BD5